MDNTNADSKESTASDRPSNYLQACLKRLPGHPPRVEAAVDEHGRYWLEDTKGTDEAYIWTRDVVDVGAHR